MKFIDFTGLIIFMLIVSCNNPKNAQWLETSPNIVPDYRQVTIPVNIAPLNFYINEPGDGYFIEIVGGKCGKLVTSSSDGAIHFPLMKWKKLLAQNCDTVLTIKTFVKRQGQWYCYQPFNMQVSSDSIMPYIVYRKIDPGNIFWANMGIYQRNLATFEDTPIALNNLTDHNCMNCHAFANYNPELFLLHFRKLYAGTLIINHGESKFLDTKTKYTISNATYSAWHPSGKYIAFSVNKIIQKFFAQTDKYEMVVDTLSDIILYDVDKNTVASCPQLTTRWLENIPSWSPDGRYLYYISAKRYDAENYRNIKYDLLRIPFDPKTSEWGIADTLLNSLVTGKSYSFPSVSPDGRYLLFVQADYGYFTIHNREADICIMDLSTMKMDVLPINSPFVESYPVWSANGRWIMFVSKRDNNMFSRPWFCHFVDTGHISKPFVLPQSDPYFYDNYLLNFNRPEFVSGKVNVDPWKIKDKITTQKPEPVLTSRYQNTDGVSGATATK